MPPSRVVSHGYLTIQYISPSIGQLIKSIREPQMNTVIDSLVEFIGGKDDELRDIAGLGKGWEIF